jgi:hypothetical protein
MNQLLAVPFICQWKIANPLVKAGVESEDFFNVLHASYKYTKGLADPYLLSDFLNKSQLFYLVYIYLICPHILVKSLETVANNSRVYPEKSVLLMCRPKSTTLIDVIF